jgi:hypothetical protein
LFLRKVLEENIYKSFPQNQQFTWKQKLCERASIKNSPESAASNRLLYSRETKPPGRKWRL